MLYGVNCSCFSRCAVLGGTIGDGNAFEQFRLFVYYEDPLLLFEKTFIKIKDM